MKTFFPSLIIIILLVSTTAMAVAIDPGEWNDIHPLNKKDVDQRLEKHLKEILET